MAFRPRNADTGRNLCGKLMDAKNVYFFEKQLQTKFMQD